ncbi:MAG TPA: hypothetical protein VK762_25680 [Polyangiaceae bacterium]|nr:hypothetical protein [Polyangiaceae bacterium]
MGIDRIGKNGPPVPVPEVGGSTGTAPAGSAFQVPPAKAPTAAASPRLDAASGVPVDPTKAATAAGGAPLERLRAGDLDLGGYVDAKVHEATVHLSALPPVELEKIRSALRERLSSDPTLIDLLHTATGETLPPDDS